MAKQKQVVFKQKPNHRPVACNYRTIEHTKDIAPKAGCVSTISCVSRAHNGILIQTVRNKSTHTQPALVLFNHDYCTLWQRLCIRFQMVFATFHIPFTSAKNESALATHSLSLRGHSLFVPIPLALSPPLSLRPDLCSLIRMQNEK